MSVKEYDSFLGRERRSGTWHQMSQGTYQLVLDKIQADQPKDAAELLELATREADELHDVYGRWPEHIVDWLRQQNTPEADLKSELDRLRELLGRDTMEGFESGWQQYIELTRDASNALRMGAGGAQDVERVRSHWQYVHDNAVDCIYGLLDVAVRLQGESRLGDIWNFLMADWYDEHEKRFALDSQPWSESKRQLMVAITDGFHSHLTGKDRHGDIEYIEEEDRVGFRFAPCGSGGQTMEDASTGNRPRPGPPYDFAVTSDEHDWAWNTKGICGYCIHCCLLNEIMPIDRLGFPTRVIDPPTWPESREGSTCTWWVYKDPSLVPDSVYRRVGRDPKQRPNPNNEE